MTRPFGIVLAGGGARGFAHVGVLRALEHAGLVPSVVVGVSMGAVVGVTYATRHDWYDALLSVDFAQFSRVGSEGRPETRIRRTVEYAHTAWSMMRGWGAPAEAIEAGRMALNDLLRSARLEDARIPVAVCATDLQSGDRVTFRTGSATEAVYASMALAGILPPLARDETLLADGAYSGVAPVDVAKEMGASTTVVVDPGQTTAAGPIENGVQALMRAMEICYRKHAVLSMEEATLVLKPDFGAFVDTLEFSSWRRCLSAGVRCVRESRDEIRALLDAGSDEKRQRM